MTTSIDFIEMMIYLIGTLIFFMFSLVIIEGTILFYHKIRHSYNRYLVGDRWDWRWNTGRKL